MLKTLSERRGKQRSAERSFYTQQRKAICKIWANFIKRISRKRQENTQSGF